MTDRPVLKITSRDYETLRRALLTRCGREHKLYATVGRRAPGFTVHRLLMPSDADYSTRSATFVELTPHWMMQTLRWFAESDADGILEAHSHPFSDRAAFSSTDDHYITGVREDFQRKRPDSAFLRLVVGRRDEGFSLQAFDSIRSVFRDIDEIVIVGDDGARHVRAHGSEGATGPRDTAYYDRLAAVRTPEEHARIGRAAGVLIGSGGTGWLAGQLLPCLGVGNLTLVDADLVEPANLNRLVGVTQADVIECRPKVERLASILREQDPTRSVAALVERFPSEASIAAVERADYVVCAVDDPLTRLAVQRLCARHLVPALDVGSSIYLDEKRQREAERHGHAWLYIPGKPCWLHMGLREQGLESDTLRQARRAAGYVVDDPRQSPGSVQTLNAAVVAAGLTLLEAYLCGRRPAHQVILHEERVQPTLTLRTKQYAVADDSECPLCGSQGVVGQGGNPFEHCADAPLVVPAPGSLEDLVQV